MKLLIFTILIIPLFILSQQEARLLISHGAGTIFDFDFSPDSKKIVTGGWDKSVKIWDCATGMETHTLTLHNERVLSVKFSPDGKYIVSAAFDSIINVWDAKTYQLITSFNAGAPNVACVFDKQSTGLIVAHSTGEMSTWFVKDWKIIDRWQAHESYINDIKIGPNNNLIFSAGADGKWKIWKMSDPSINSSTDMKTPIQNMSINSTGDKIVLVYGNTLMEVLDYPGFDNGIAIAEIFAIAYLGFPFYTQPTFTNDGKNLAYSNDKGEVTLVDLASINKSKTQGSVLTINCEHSKFIQKTLFSKNGKYMATSSFDGSIRLTIFNNIELTAGNYKTGEIVNSSFKKLNSELDRLYGVYYTDNNTLCMYGANTYYYNLKTGEQITYNPYKIGGVAFTKINTPLGLYQYNLKALGVWKGEEIAAWTIPPWSCDLRFKSLFITDSNQYMRINLENNEVIYSGELKGQISHPVTNADGTKLAFLMADNTIQIRDTGSGEFIKLFNDWSEKINKFDFNNAGDKLVVSFFEDDSRIYSVSSGNLITKINHGEWGATTMEFSSDDKLLIFGTFHDNIELYNAQTYQKIWEMNTGEYIEDVSFSQDASQFTFYGSSDAVITYDLKTKQEIIRYYPLVFKGVVSITPEHYYMAPSFIEDEIGFYSQGKVYPMEQFDLKYNRPDKVLNSTGKGDKKLIKAYRKAHEKRIKTMKVKDASTGFHAPEIKVKEIDNLAGIIVKDKIEFTVITQDSLVGLSRINIWINDVSIYGKNGIEISGNSIEKVLKLDLASGMNKIQVTVSNQAGVESFKETFKVVNEVVKEKGNLYVISIGTSKYANEKFNLTYASKDAADFAKAMSQNKQYKKVFVKTLLDKDVTLENIHKVKSFLSKATRDDMAMVFVAGHGVLDQDYTYYYCPHDMDFEDPSSRGISYEELESILDGITPLKKLLFMDTCHSGEVDEEDVTINTEETVESGDVVFRSVWKVESKTGFGLSNTTQLMKSMFLDLRKGTGATVISSAGGAEYAMESAEWKNGLFTYSLLKGFKNNEADLNNDGKLMLSELQAYVSNMVTKLSQGKQTPTSRIVNNELDYRLR